MHTTAIHEQRDVWVAVHPQKAEKMVAVLKEFGFDLPELSVDLFLEENKIIRRGVPPIRIEILTTISGVNFGECYAERRVEALDDVEVNFISLRHLQINKKACGRHKDWNDLENLPGGRCDSRDSKEIGGS